MILAASVANVLLLWGGLAMTLGSARLWRGGPGAGGALPGVRSTAPPRRLAHGPERPCRCSPRGGSPGEAARATVRGAGGRSAPVQAGDYPWPEPPERA